MASIGEQIRSFIKIIHSQIIHYFHYGILIEQHPLYTITHPERASDFINSMVKIYEHQGKLPVWHLRGNETNTMPGYSGVPVVVDAALKGLDNIDIEKIYEAAKTSATGDFEPGVKELMQYGYIPADFMVESVASNMEYAIGDWGIAQLAKKLGKDEDYKYFKKRSELYKEYFDEETKFMRGKLSDGSWRTPFDPVSAQHRVNDYCEGNAWQYLWLVPQDPEGLIELLGGDDAFNEKLDELFSMSSEQEIGASMDITGLIGQYAHGNEPSHHTTYMYAFSGQPYKIADKVRHINNKLYTDQPDGLSGNEDCGQMSAWYIFSSIGFYPVNPSNGAYIFGSPLFDNVEIDVPGRKKFTVKTVNNSDENIYIQSVFLNGKKHDYSYITHKQITNGGELKFIMGSKPNYGFGVNKSSDQNQSYTNEIYSNNIIIFFFTCQLFTNNLDDDYVSYVNPLIGTDSSFELSKGNTYPAIARPWGMNFWTPQTGKMGDGWAYQYQSNEIVGFKQTHQPSPWINDYGAFSIMPSVGEIKVNEKIEKQASVTKMKLLSHTTIKCF